VQFSDLNPYFQYKQGISYGAEIVEVVADPAADPRKIGHFPIIRLYAQAEYLRDFCVTRLCVAMHCRANHATGALAALLLLQQVTV
jgi:hypothetical protein